jgi:hypothetical protein
MLPLRNIENPPKISHKGVNCPDDMSSDRMKIGILSLVLLSKGFPVLMREEISSKHGNETFQSINLAV